MPPLVVMLRRSLLVLPALALVAAACSGPTSGELTGVVYDEPVAKPSFALTDLDGQPYDFVAETEGKLTLLFFGYTSCPDICPVHLAQIAEVFDQQPRIARAAEVVFVTVDPERDTPEVMRAWLDRFDSRFVGLTGTIEELDAAQEAAGLALAIRDEGDEDYLVGHASQVLAFAPDGLGYSVYPFGTLQSDWLNDLPILVGLTAS